MVSVTEAFDVSCASFHGLPSSRQALAPAIRPMGIEPISMHVGGGGADTSKPTIAAEHRMMRKARPTAPQGPGPEPGNWFADTVQTRCFAVDLRDLTK